MKLSDIKKISFPHKPIDGSSLSIFEEGVVPFAIKRVFTIEAKDLCTRGLHAHKKCSQLLVCLKGECLVRCKEGKDHKSFLLNTPSEGLFIPPTIWAEQQYQAGTLLMVLTDQLYDEADYIREYDDFLEYRKSMR